MYVTILPLFLVVLVFIVIFHFRKKKILKKLCCMSHPDKCHQLDELITPLGYWFDPVQEIFSSRTDAWQKSFGYGKFYDKAAPFFNMVFDCQPVYFDYQGQTWLIEFWKGQYGINTGSEVGIYHSDTLVSPEERKTALFQAVKEKQYLDITTRLCRGGCPVAELSMPHWWLTIFSMGCFSHPRDLSLEVSLRFPDFEMLDAFVEELLNIGYDPKEIQLYVHDLHVSFVFRTPKKHCRFFRHIHNCFVLWKNHLFCRLFNFVTRSCNNTCDKLLYLYYYLPFAFRRMLRLHRCKKGHRWYR